MSLWCMLQYYSIQDAYPKMKEKWLADKAHVVDSYQSFDQLPPERQEEVTKLCKGIKILPPPVCSKSVCDRSNMLGSPINE